VDHFSPVLPVVVNLRNEGLQERHWEQIHGLIGFEIKGRPEITLGELLEKKVGHFACHQTYHSRFLISWVSRRGSST